MIAALVIGAFLTSKYRAYRQAQRLKNHFSSKKSARPADTVVGDS